MKLRNLPVAVLLLILLFHLAGCGRFTKPTGTLSGRIVYTDGSPVSGAQVVLLEHNRMVETGANGAFTFIKLQAGRYTLAVSNPAQATVPSASKQFAGYKLVTEPGALAVLQAPDGRQEPLSAAKPQVASFGVSNSNYKTLQVAVAQGQTANAGDIIIAPMFSHTDGVALVEAQPDFGTTLAGGASTNISFDVYYGLESLNEGKVGLVVYYEANQGSYLVAKYEAPISKGSGKVALGGTIKVPAVVKLELQVVLLDASNNVLMLSYINGYQVAGGPTPPAPYLRAEATPFGTRLTWGNGSPSPFTKLEIHRSVNKQYVYTDGLIATITDKTTTSFMDIGYPGWSSYAELTQYYQLVAYTSSGERYYSNIVDIEFMQTFDKISFEGPLGGIAVDQQGFYYVSDTTNNRILVLSTDTNRIVDEVPVCAFPAGLSINQEGSLLAVACGGASHVMTVNLQDRTQVKTIAGFDRPYRVIFDPDGTTLYVGGYGRVWKADVLIGKVVQSVFLGDLYWSNMAITPTGLLFTAGGSDSMRVISTSDFTNVQQLKGLPPVVASQTRNEVYFGKDYNNSYLYHTDSGTLTTLDTRVIALTVDNRRAYGIGNTIVPNGDPVRTLRVLDNESSSWVTRHQVQLNRLAGMIGDPPAAVLTPDGKKMYMIYGGNSVLAFDLQALGVL